MEVHHHSHTERKKFTHYLWEFLMLFLAVFSGFLAEYQLEHVIEHQREKEYALLLVEDLKADTVYINQIRSQKLMKVSYDDSLMALLKNPARLNDNYNIIRLLYNAGVFSDFKPAFPVNFEQIKNSGSLRYFRNKKLIGLLSKHNRNLETTIQVIKGHNDFFLNNITPFLINFLNSAQFDNINKIPTVPNPDIYNWNKREAIILANKLSMVKFTDYVAAFLLEQNLNQSKDLIGTIRKSYHLN